MKFSGHTMGTPLLNLRGAMKLFSEIGFDAMELRDAKDGQIDTTIADDDYIALINSLKRQYGIDVCCLTPYFKDFVSDLRELELARMKRAIQIASLIGCPNIRAYGGIDPEQSRYTRSEIFEKTASGLYELGTYANAMGVRICIETHAYTLTISAKEVMDMVNAVNLPNVGVLLDYAWVAWANEETLDEALDLMKSKIFHCHIKDYLFESNNKRPNKKSCLLGEGSIPLQKLADKLKAVGFDGSVSDEYEKYWNYDVLPEPEIGMKQNLAYMKKIFRED